MTVKAAFMAPYAGEYRHRITTPGQFYFLDAERNPAPPPAPGEVGYFRFACPRSGECCGDIPIGNGFKPEGDKSWQWDGNIESPTLTPSINCLSHGPNGEKYAGCGWHAWVTAGEFTGE